MANKQTVEEPTDLMSLGNISGTLERPKSLDPNDRTGTEDIGADELRLPRLSIAQGLSHEITEGDSSFIEGLKNFDMFNNMLGDIYGRGPLMFVPLQRDTKRIEFRPRSEGGGIIDMDVPKGDPRLQWTTLQDGTRVPPRATEFVEFPSLLLRPNKQPEPIVISIKMTNKWNRRAADQLTLFIKMRNAAIYAGLYTISSKPEKNDKGTFGVPVMKNAGFIPIDSPAGKALFEFAERTAKAFEGKTIIVEREPGSDDEFDPATMDGQKTGTEM